MDRSDLGSLTIAYPDPNKVPGAKADSGKPRVAMWMRTVPRAILEVAKVATFGADKYTPYGCLSVPRGEQRYDDAGMRHWLEDAIEPDGLDPESHIIHLAHDAWNRMMRLELALRRIKEGKPYEMS